MDKESSKAPSTNIWPRRMEGGPPYDGDPCMMCPTEIRALFDIAMNVVLEARQSGQVKEQNIEDLQNALIILKPHMDAHFLNIQHSVPPEVLAERLEKAKIYGLQN